jgi:hypothetical protein
MQLGSRRFGGSAVAGEERSERDEGNGPDHPSPV